MSLSVLDKECGPKCRSRKHVEEIISVIVYGNLAEFKAVSMQCYNWAKHSDQFGRTALHVAASCGKADIVEWLLEEKRVDLGTKDYESGYTALHRALFYGQVACARLLTQFGSDLQVRDVEGMTPIDLAMMDRPAHITFSEGEPNEVFAWGENYNSTLGHSSPHKRTTPEAVDTFKKAGISIKQCVLNKYHSVFLSQSGQVYTCGHGQGGRLGHGDQNTMLVPCLLETVSELTCLQIAASTDHTLLRMEGGAVYSFGLNDNHQLGLTPYAESSFIPKQMNLKPLKGKAVCGICTGRFHSVLWTHDSVYTVGLSAGQLGHPKGEKHQTLLRQVSGLRHTDLGVARVACSDAATVCLTTKGDVFVLHEYQCRKIASKWQEIEQILVTGGNLDHSTGVEMLSEKGGSDINIMMRNTSGQLFLWRQSSPTMKRCQFALKRQLCISHVTMTTSSLIMCTNKGEAFIGYLSNKKASMPVIKETTNKEYAVKECGDGFSQTRLLDLLLRDEAEDIQVRRIPFVHRAVMATGDRKGRNFVALQALPNGCLSELPSVRSSVMSDQFGQLQNEADVNDSIHDAVIQLGSHSWPVHRYIVASRSDFLRNLVLAEQGSEELVLKVEGFSPELMEQIITFMYTDTCDYLTLGHMIKQPSASTDPEQKGKSKSKSKHSNRVEDSVIPMKGESAFQVEQKRNKGKREQQKSESDSKEHPVHSQNPVRQLQEAARKLGVRGMSKRLDAVKLHNGVITSHGKSLTKPKLKFDRMKLPELYDVTIATDDGKELQCHKCVLVARLEYFYSMLATGWVESFNNSRLTLPVPGDVLEVLIDFLYTDEAVQLRDCTYEDFLCNVLIMSDQMLAWRLKEICEVALANIISFKNASELLEFSCIYNAEQLKLSCQQFISYNLPAMVEGRHLEVLSSDTLDELTAYYRNTIPNMCRRMITCGCERLPQSQLDELVSEYEHLHLDETSHLHTEQNMAPGKKSNKQQQKKKGRQKHKSVNEDADSKGQGPKSTSGIDRNISVSSDISVKSEEDITAVIEEIHKKAEEEDKRLEAVARSKAKWQPFDLRASPARFENSDRPAPIQPEDIPAWNSSFKTLSRTPVKSDKNTVEASSDVLMEEPPSPSMLASSPTSLRDIMQEESKHSDRKRSSFSSRVSWKDIKKQQTKDSKEKPRQDTPTAQVAAAASPKAPSNPWGSVGSAVKSFRDLMIQEQTVAAIPSPQTKERGSMSVNSKLQPVSGKPQPVPGKLQPVPGAMISPGTSPRAGSLAKSPPAPSSTCWGLASRTTSKSLTFTEPSSPPTQVENPWQQRAALASSPPSHTPLLNAPNFSDILQDEKEKIETLIRTTQKPLALIQLEEEAMSELLRHYNASKKVEEYITVERVSKAMAAPLWRRERNSSTTQT